MEMVGPIETADIANNVQNHKLSSRRSMSQADESVQQQLNYLQNAYLMEQDEVSEKSGA